MAGATVGLSVRRVIVRHHLGFHQVTGRTELGRIQVVIRHCRHDEEDKQRRCCPRGEDDKTTQARALAERGLRFLRDVHIGLGAIALVGVVVFPQFELLSVVAVYEGINALAHEGLRQVIKTRPNRRPQPT